MRVASLLLAILLSGCSANTNVRLGSGGAAVPPGTAVAGSSVGAQLQYGSAAATLIGIAILAAAWHTSESDRYGVDRLDPFAPVSRPGLGLQLDESRRVYEQDCTRPIEDWSANLKCK